MMRILMVNLPYAGHTNPTLPLARALVGRGHAVGYINAPEWREKIERTGATFIPYRNYPDHPTEQQQKTRCMLAAYETAMAVGKDYDALVYEMLFFPGKTVAQRLGIPCVRQFSQMAWCAQTVRYAKSHAKLWALSCWLINWQMFGRATAKRMDMVGKNLVDSVLADVPGLNIVYVPEAFQPCRDALDGRFVFALPAAAPDPRAAPAQPAEPAQPAFDYGRMKRPLIYISMGSIMSSRIFCRRCVKAFGDRDVSVILSTGKVDPEALGKLPPNIHARPFVPQLEVLSHADLFITHCGMNSVNEAMAFGVPMLALPVMNDQPINAAQLERLGIGARMRAFPIDAGMLRRNAMGVLADERIRQNAAAMRERVLSGPNIEAAAARIEAFLGQGGDGGGRGEAAP